MTGKQRTVHYLIMVGFYQLLYTRIPAHAALAETVEGAVAIKRPQLKGLINGVLRQFQRQQEALHWPNLPKARVSLSGMAAQAFAKIMVAAMASDCRCK